jgi:FSR family fosmidomycin resistance protein-like MFS transporter
VPESDVFTDTGLTPGSPAGAEDFQTGHVLTVSLAHFLNDTYTSFLAPILPTLISRLGLSNTQAGLLAFIQSTPSLLQPLIGHLADRASLRYFVILTPALAASTMSFLGVAPTFAVVALLVAIAGLSSATFHAAAPAMAGRLSGSRLGRGIGLWTIGGYLGFAVGPLLVAGTVRLLTLEGTPWLAIGGWLGSALLYLRLRGVALQPAPSTVPNSWRHGLQGMRPILIPVVGLIVSRAMAFSATLTFLPILLTTQGAPLSLAGVSLSLVQLTSAAGALLAGSASDRLGRRLIILVSLLTSPVLLVALVSLHGSLKLPVLIGLGLTMPAVNVVLMALMQETCPDNRALATGVLLSLTFVSESVGAVLLGALADLFGLTTAFAVSALSLSAGLPLILLLPRDHPADPPPATPR